MLRTALCTALLSVVSADWTEYYEGDCTVLSVSSKENAVQCVCKPQAEQLYGSVPDRMATYQHCLAGRIRGGLGGRTLGSLYAENICDGQPMPVNSFADWTSPDTMYFYWAEDSDDWTTAGTHIEKVQFTPTGANIVAHIKLQQCVHNGGLTRGKDGKLAVLCAEAAGWAKWLHLKVVEVETDLSKEVRRFSVLREECRATGECKGAYPMQKGADFRMLEYILSRNWYVAFHNGEWGGHVADAINFWDADTEKQVSGYGDSWACMGGHTETARMAYNAKVDELAVLCCSDFGGACTDPAKQKCDVDDQWKNGLVFRNHISKTPSVAVAPFVNVHYGAISGWLGDLLSCGDGFVQAWHGADGLKDVFDAQTNDVGFMKLSKTGEVQLKKWVIKTTGTRERSVKLAKLGSGDCDRFLLGWGEMAADAYYPAKYFLKEIDGDGNDLTEPIEVTEATMWGEDSQWATLGNGDVAWAHTWKRNDDGTPNKVGQKPNGKTAGKSCTWNGNGYGYTWGGLDDRPGGRFHTNEAFTTRYYAKEADVDECAAVPCGKGQTCAEGSQQLAKDFTCTCGDAKARGAPAICKTDAPPTAAPIPATPLPEGSTYVPDTPAPATPAPATTAPATPAPDTRAPRTVTGKVVTRTQKKTFDKEEYKKRVALATGESVGDFEVTTTDAGNGELEVVTSFTGATGAAAGETLAGAVGTGDFTDMQLQTPTPTSDDSSSSTPWWVWLVVVLGVVLLAGIVAGVVLLKKCGSSSSSPTKEAPEGNNSPDAGNDTDAEA